MSIAREIALVLGGSRAQLLADGSYLTGCPVPSHGKGRGDRSPSLCIRDGNTRVLVHCFAGCDARAVLDELRRRGLIDDRAPIERPTLTRREMEPHGGYKRRQHRRAAWLWSQRRPITGTVAEKYLQGRGITCPLPATLGFLAPSKPEHHPAMIAAFATPPGLDAVHLTQLNRNGTGKAEIEKPKLMIGSPGAWPIVLAPVNDLLGLAITEGIEDALSVHQTTGLGAWAAGSAGRMLALADVIPSYIETVTIFAHPDPAGRQGARKLAEALDRRGIEVFVEGVS